MCYLFDYSNGLLRTLLTPSKEKEQLYFLLGFCADDFDNHQIKEHSLAKHPTERTKKKIVKRGSDYYTSNLYTKYEYLV